MDDDLDRSMDDADNDDHGGCWENMEPEINVYDVRLGAALSLLLHKNPDECLVLVNFMEKLNRTRRFITASFRIKGTVRFACIESLLKIILE